MYTLGVDCHKKYAQVAVLDEAGTLVMNTKVSNEPEAFKHLLGDLPGPCQAVVESGYGWGSMYDMLTDLGVDVHVAHALKVKAIASASIKTDSIDARTLGQLLHAHLIPEVYVPSRDIRSQKDILRQRCWLVRFKTMMKNRIHQILMRNHAALPDVKDIFGVQGRKFLAAVALKEPDQTLLLQDLEILDYIQQHIKHTESWIETTLQENDYRRIIMSVPGFGKILSALVALETADIHRFAHAGKFSSYAGLVPTTYASGGRVSHGRLLPGCNRWMRYAFIEAAWTAIAHSPYFRGIYARMKKNKSPQVAIACVARRLAEIVFQCLTQHRPYEERPYIVRKHYAA